MIIAKVASDNGEEEMVAFTEADYLDWYKKNTAEDGKVTKAITIYGKAPLKIRKDDGTTWMMTDMTLDRDMERVDPHGADLKSFRKNPVVLWAHDHSRPAIGHMESVAVRDGQLKGKVVLDPPEVDSFAGMIAKKVERKTINAGSIGFMPKVVEIVEDEKDPARLIHKKWELREFSLCNVPAHPGALAEHASKEATAEEADPLQDIVARLDKIEAEIHAPGRDSGETPYSLLFSDEEQEVLIGDDEAKAEEADLLLAENNERKESANA